MIVKPTPADFERAEQYARPRFKVLLNPDARKNSKTPETSAVFHARALRVYACNNRPRSISENITLQKLNLLSEN